MVPPQAGRGRGEGGKGVKRGTMELAKFVNFADEVGGKLIAVGVLESLWHVTAREAPQGDIGKLTDKTIAKLIGWTRDPEALINPLREHNWLDPHPVHRYVVHDWHDHADDALRKRLERAKLPFLSRLPQGVAIGAETPAADSGGDRQTSADIVNPHAGGSGSGCLDSPIPIDAGAREAAPTAVPLLPVWDREEAITRLLLAFPPSNGSPSRKAIQQALYALGGIGGRFESEAAAEVFLASAIAAYAASPRCRTTPQKYRPSMVRWFGEAMYDNPPEAWAVKFQGENGHSHGAQAPGKTGANERLKAEEARVAAERSQPKPVRPRLLNG